MRLKSSSRTMNTRVFASAVCMSYVIIILIKPIEILLVGVDSSHYTIIDAFST